MILFLLLGIILYVLIAGNSYYSQFRKADFAVDEAKE